MGKEKDDGKEEVIVEEESGMEEQDEDESKVDDDKPIQRETDGAEVRRSTRHRAVLDRLQYKSQGNPVV